MDDTDEQRDEHDGQRATPATAVRAPGVTRQVNECGGSMRERDEQPDADGGCVQKDVADFTDAVGNEPLHGLFGRPDDQSCQRGQTRTSRGLPARTPRMRGRTAA